MSSATHVSVIMPVYNAADYVVSAVESVLGQSHREWELIIVNDGSTDASHDRLQPLLDDPRIRYFRQDRLGVSAARNRGLREAGGEWLCFLDADDLLPPRSLASRLNLSARRPEATFIDGAVQVFHSASGEVVGAWEPSFRGAPQRTLLFETPRCFYACSWMIRNTGSLRPFLEGLTHAEDLLFLIQNAHLGPYDFVGETILRLRRGHGSAMGNLRGLDAGYRTVLAEVRRDGALPADELERLRRRYRSIMLKSYLKAGHPLRALGVWLSFQEREVE